MLSFRFVLCNIWVGACTFVTPLNLGKPSWLWRFDRKFVLLVALDTFEFCRICFIYLPVDFCPCIILLEILRIPTTPRFAVWFETVSCLKIWPSLRCCESSDPPSLCSINLTNSSEPNGWKLLKSALLPDVFCEPSCCDLRAACVTKFYELWNPSANLVFYWSMICLSIFWFLSWLLLTVCTGFLAMPYCLVTSVIFALFLGRCTELCAWPACRAWRCRNFGCGFWFWLRYTLWYFSGDSDSFGSVVSR